MSGLPPLILREVKQMPKRSRKNIIVALDELRTCFAEASKLGQLLEDDYRTLKPDTTLQALKRIDVPLLIAETRAFMNNRGIVTMLIQQLSATKPAPLYDDFV